MWSKDCNIKVRYSSGCRASIIDLRVSMCKSLSLMNLFRNLGPWRRCNKPILYYRWKVYEQLLNHLGCYMLFWLVLVYGRDYVLIQWGSGNEITLWQTLWSSLVTSLSLRSLYEIQIRHLENGGAVPTENSANHVFKNLPLWTALSVLSANSLLNPGLKDFLLIVCLQSGFSRFACWFFIWIWAQYAANKRHNNWRFSYQCVWVSWSLLFSYPWSQLKFYLEHLKLSVILEWIQIIYSANINY